MIGYWNYTTWLTYISVLLATFGIGICVSNFEHATDVAIICLMICGALDMFDGKVARKKKDRTEMQKDFGIQIDSLSDLIAFGVLPALIGLKLVYPYHNKWYFFGFVVVLLLYVLFGLVRLGYFNALENERMKNEDGVLKYYTGLPITMASLFMPIVYILKFFVKSSVFKYVYFLFLFIVGVLFIVKVKMPKAGKKMIISFTICGVAMIALFITLIVL